MALEKRMKELVDKSLNQLGTEGESCENDDVLVDYVVGIVETLISEQEDGSVSSEDFDFHSFFEMLCAYLPSAQGQGSDKISEWFTNLLGDAEKLRHPRNKCRSSASSDSDCGLDFSLQLSKDEKESYKNQKSASHSSAVSQSVDSDLKTAITSKHYMVPEDTETFHKPPPAQKTTGETSRIRYLDGKVVSVKGDKFVQLKSEESEEMKKTYVHLKPARKYRFH